MERALAATVQPQGTFRDTVQRLNGVSDEE